MARPGPVKQNAVMLLNTLSQTTLQRRANRQQMLVIRTQAASGGFPKGGTARTVDCTKLLVLSEYLLLAGRACRHSSTSA